MSGENSIPDWQLERFLLGELPEQEAGEIRDALARDPSLGERVAALQRSNAEILDRRPARVVASGIQERLAASPKPAPAWLGRWAVAAGTLTVAAIAAHFSMIQPDRKPDITRTKGGAGPRLMLYRKAAAAPAEPLEPGSRARARDVVQIVYQVGARRYGAIVSVDGRGNVTAHLPKAGGRAVALTAGGPVPLPEAYELDDAPAFERFYLVTAPEPFPVEVVTAALRVRPPGKLPLPEGFDQLSFELAKEAVR